MISNHDNYYMYLKVPGVNPDRLEGRQRYIPITCTLSPGYVRKAKTTLLRLETYNLLKPSRFIEKF